jgi:hypothetical protein
MKAFFGGAIAVVLLGIYVHLIRVAYLIVDCASQGCTSRIPQDFNDVMAQTLTVVGGLVSALIVTELAITQPGDAPLSRVLGANPRPLPKTILKAITVIYIFVWLVAGLVAFIEGMYNPNILPPLTSFGQSWLGLAVAAAYSYFGMQPGNNNNSELLDAYLKQDPQEGIISRR